jgi:hypothetical protein
MDLVAGSGTTRLNDHRGTDIPTLDVEIIPA